MVRFDGARRRGRASCDGPSRTEALAGEINRHFGVGDAERFASDIPRVREKICQCM